LIVNEALTNAAKYGFSDDAAGKYSNNHISALNLGAAFGNLQSGGVGRRVWTVAPALHGLCGLTRKRAQPKWPDWEEILMVALGRTKN
jgi:hypothetical protein